MEIEFENSGDKEAWEMGEKVTHKDTIQIWYKAIKELEDGNIDACLTNFEQIIDTSAKIYFNVGALWFRKRNYSKAVTNFLACTERDPHMAIGHFALGLTYAKLEQYNKSRQHYEKSQKCLRGNPKIDYTQLGLKFVLRECDIIYDLALTLATMMKEFDWAIEVLEEGLKTATDEIQGERMKDAIQSLKGEVLYDPILLPTEVFRPPQSKVENLKDINFLGQKKVISTLSVRQKPAGQPSAPRTPDKSPNPLRSNSKEKPVPPSIPPSPPSHAFKPIQPGQEGEKMSHKDSLQMWHEGVLAFESGKIDSALEKWLNIQDPSAKILFNITIALIDQGDTDGAVKTCHGVINKDKHLAIGHFLLGEVQCKKRHYDDAWKSFDAALQLLRGKDTIDYSQLGLAHKLYKCEILYNQAFCYLHSGMDEWTSHLLTEAQSSKVEPKHSYIDEALKKCLVGQPFEYVPLPSNAIFKPPKSKIDNLGRQSFLGKAKVVSQLKGTESKPPASSVASRVTTPPRVPSPPSLRVSTPPRIPSPIPPSVRPPSVPAPPPPSLPVASPDILQPPSRTVSTELSGRSSPGPPSRPPPVLPISRSKSPIPGKGPPMRKVPPPPKIMGSGPRLGATSFDPDKPLPPAPVNESPSNTSNSSPVLKRKGPPNKALPPPPVSRTSTQSSHSSSGSSSPRSLSPSFDERQKLSSGPPKKPLPPSPLSLSPISVSPRSTSPVKLIQSRSQSIENKLVKPVISGPNREKREGKPVSSLPTLRRTSAVVISGYEANTDEELTLSEGDIVKVLSQNGDWTKGDLRGKEGIFPSQCIQDHAVRSFNSQR
ncbi:uncharacterized protein [Apostichopus japonicus]|uniref:uncharacterized protein isoform X1 n=2 Tax=Stichopus japonicus TaxID=307972 RepID=UPI003AB738F8